MVTYLPTRNSLEITIQHPDLAVQLPIAAPVGKAFVTVRNLKLREPKVCRAPMQQPRGWQLTQLPSQELPECPIPRFNVRMRNRRRLWMNRLTGVQRDDPHQGSAVISGSRNQ